MAKTTGVRQGRGKAKKGGNRRKREPFGIRARRYMKRLLFIALVAAAIPVSGYGAWRLYGLVTTTEYLAVDKISVEGVSRISADTVAKLAGIESGENIFSFKLSEVERRILENPWIKSVTVSRSIPSTVRIEVVERAPAAVVSADGLYVMDSGGLLFKRYSVADGLDLPIVTGLDPETVDSGVQIDDHALMGLLGRLTGRHGISAKDISEIRIDPMYGYTLYTVEEGVELDLGIGAFEGKLGAFDKIVKARGGKLTGVAAIDLTRKNEVVIRYIGNVVKEGGAT